GRKRSPGQTHTSGLPEAFADPFPPWTTLVLVYESMRKKTTIPPLLRGNGAASSYNTMTADNPITAAPRGTS
ncbi:MAG: hypothetical protein WBH86_12570, partial [Thermogutta sp.]